MLFKNQQEVVQATSESKGKAVAQWQSIGLYVKGPKFNP